MKPSEPVYLTPMPVRIWHWLNALGIVTLCITGLQIRFPDMVNIFGTYKAAIRLHNTAGIVVSISFCLWLCYYLVVARSLFRLYVPTKEELRRGLVRQALFYFWHYFTGRPAPYHATPDNKFNPMQKTAYMMIMMVLLPLVILTGLLLLHVSALREWISLIGGIKVLVSVHFLLACIFFAFLFVHIYLATLGHTPLAHFRPMWTGWEESGNGGTTSGQGTATTGHCGETGHTTGRPT